LVIIVYYIIYNIVCQLKLTFYKLQFVTYESFIRKDFKYFPIAEFLFDREFWSNFLSKKLPSEFHSPKEVLAYKSDIKLFLFMVCRAKPISS